MNAAAQKVFDLLMAEARQTGIAPVRDACKLFLKTGIKMRPEKVDPRREIPRSMVRIAWEKQGGRCNICHNALAWDEAEGEHVVPHISGGPLKQSNIAAAHGKKSEVNCNAKKSDNDLYTESKRTGYLFNEILPTEETNGIRETGVYDNAPTEEGREESQRSEV